VAGTQKFLELPRSLSGVSIVSPKKETTSPDRPTRQTRAIPFHLLWPIVCIFVIKCWLRILHIIMASMWLSDSQSEFLVARSAHWRKRDSDDQNHAWIIADWGVAEIGVAFCSGGMFWLAIVRSTGPRPHCSLTWSLCWCRRLLLAGRRDALLRPGNARHGQRTNDTCPHSPVPPEKLSRTNQEGFPRPFHYRFSSSSASPSSLAPTRRSSSSRGNKKPKAPLPSSAGWRSSSSSGRWSASVSSYTASWSCSATSSAPSPALRATSPSSGPTLASRWTVWAWGPGGTPSYLYRPGRKRKNAGSHYRLACTARGCCVG